MVKSRRTLLMTIFIVCISIVCFSAQALGGYDDYDAYDGDGWSMSTDGVLAIESDQGWANCIRDGFKPEVSELVIGKDVTYFRLYDLPNDLPSPDFFDSCEVVGYDKNGEPYYNYSKYLELFPLKISVEAGNQIFQVVDGLLINTETKELVLSEMGVTDVMIPEGIKTITLQAFLKRNVTTIRFPESLEVIGTSAFSRCEGLTSVVLPESLIELQDSAFIYCTNLRSITLPKNLRIIPSFAFAGSEVEYLHIPSEVTEIGKNAFLECENLKQVVLPNNLKKIEGGAFGDCEQLCNINLPEGLESIGRGAFSYCTSLKIVKLPDSLQLIGQSAFAGCELSLLRIPEKLAFTIFYRDRGNIVSPHKKTDKSFDLSSVDTVILSGSDYDFGYPAITNAKNVYFLGKPPEDVGQILDEDSVEKIYCSDEFEFEWTRSSVASWVRQRLTILPAAEINAWAETTFNTTPVPTFTPKPTHEGMTLVNTPKPTPTFLPTVSPASTMEPEQKTVDPILFVFAGVLAVVVAGIVVLAARSRKPKIKAKKKSA